MQVDKAVLINTTDKSNCAAHHVIAERAIIVAQVPAPQRHASQAHVSQEHASHEQASEMQDTQLHMPEPETQAAETPASQDAPPDISPQSNEQPLRELHELTRSAGALVCAQMLVRRGKPSAATFIGSGKAHELGELVKQHNATLVIFDHPISPIQERNLEKIVECRVLDRTGLILDIFAQRATSSEGKLQVELAQLKHLSTRLVRGWSHLERQKGGIGLRGPGETQLETDRRLIGVRIKKLSHALQKVESQRALHRRARMRAAMPMVSLVGYTNAGKSALFNRLTGTRVRTADQLFATLDPTMRRFEIAGFGPAVLSDTVGFIRELPHTLIAAFHSTLEEMVNASCLLLVNDYATPGFVERRAAVEQVLAEIGAGDVPIIQINNKIDLTDDHARMRRDKDGKISTVWLSAHSGEGVDWLQQALVELLGGGRRVCTLKLKPHAGALRAMLYQRCEVMDERVDDAGLVHLRVKMSNADRGWLESRTEFNGLWSEQK